MKIPLQKLANLKTRIRDYSLVASTLEEFLLRQEGFINQVTWKSHLPPKLIKSLVHDSTLIMTVSTLMGFDVAGLKGAAIGSAVGAVVTVGNAVYVIRGSVATAPVVVY